MANLQVRPVQNPRLTLPTAWQPDPDTKLKVTRSSGGLGNKTVNPQGHQNSLIASIKGPVTRGGAPVSRAKATARTATKTRSKTTVRAAAKTSVKPAARKTAAPRSSTGLQVRPVQNQKLSAPTAWQPNPTGGLKVSRAPSNSLGFGTFNPQLGQPPLTASWTGPVTRGR